MRDIFDIGVHTQFVINDRAEEKTLENIPKGARVEFIGFILRGDHEGEHWIDANFKDIHGDEWLIGLYEVSPILNIPNT